MKRDSQKESENMKTLRMAKIEDHMYLHQGDICNIIGQMKQEASCPQEGENLGNLLETLGCNCKS